MVYPNLFIIGAPKSGTTSLARSLAQHPKVFLPFYKEPHYFGSDTKVEVNNYFSLYRSANDIPIRVDASTHTLSSSDAIPEIIRSCNNPKFIGVFRHPREAVPAFHQQMVRSLAEPCRNFGDAWAQQEARQRGEAPGPNYHRFFDYGRQVEAMLKHVKTEDLRLYTFAHLRSNGTQLLSDIQNFVGIDFYPLKMLWENESADVADPTLLRVKVGLSRQASRLKMALGLHANFGIFRRMFAGATVKRSRAELPANVRASVESAFADDLEKFAQLTGLRL